MRTDGRFETASPLVRMSIVAHAVSQCCCNSNMIFYVFFSHSMTFLTIKNLTFYYYEAGLENCRENLVLFLYTQKLSKVHTLL